MTDRDLSPQQAALMRELRRAWYLWPGSGHGGTAWDFLRWYEMRLRGAGEGRDDR